MTPRIHRITAVRVYFLPVQTRMPLKFGTETLTSVTCARVALRVADEQGREAEGWGETPLSVQWAWPSPLPYAQRHEVMQRFCCELARAWMEFDQAGHALEVGHAFLEQVLPRITSGSGTVACRRRREESLTSNPGSTMEKERLLTSSPTVGRDMRRASGSERPVFAEPLPRLAALVCNAAFDLALHDAYGRLADRPVYQTYGPEFLTSDLARFLQPAEDARLSFAARYPADYLLAKPAQRLRAWHLVGGLDPLEASELTGQEPNDGYPVLLADWIRHDGLKCLKVKLRGSDPAWDYQRLAQVGRLGCEHGVEWLSADFNCTVREPEYVNDILDRLRTEHPDIYEQLLYVEQPFAYELEDHRVDVHSLSQRKPLYLDESAHDWRLVRLGRELGWTGVALKTCKTQTGAILSACWAKAHGLGLMVQDLTNPMLAQIPHALLAAHVGTIMGVETNAMQFYPAASGSEAKVHPGLYRRRGGNIDLSSIRGPGFGYRLEEMQRVLPAPAVALEAAG